MAKYGKTASKRVKSAVSRTKKGTLRSGSGRKVTSRKQAIAIGLSEARKEGGKVPPRKSTRKGARKGARKTARKAARKTARKTGRKSSSATKRSRSKS